MLGVGKEVERCGRPGWVDFSCKLPSRELLSHSSPFCCNSISFETIAYMIILLFNNA